MTRLPPAIKRGIRISSVYYPEYAAQIEPTLAVLMKPLLANLDNLPAWKLSLLTGDGYPFEFTFTTANDGIRYTVEIEPPRQAPTERLDLAYALIHELGVPSFDEDTFHYLKQLQLGGKIEFGAWLGVRHNHKGMDFKIYVEVPPQAMEAAETYLNRHLRVPVYIKNRTIVLQMIGFYPATGVLEFYFSVYEMRPWEIIALMSPIGLEAYHQAVLDRFQWAHGRPIYQRLPAPVFGFSYALMPDSPGRSPVFSLYTFSETMFGNGSTARRKLLRYFEATGSDMAYYAEMSEPAAHETGKEHRHLHGLFGVAVSDGMPPITHIGLRPPEERTEPYA